VPPLKGLATGVPDHGFARLVAYPDNRSGPRCSPRLESPEWLRAIQAKSSLREWKGGEKPALSIS